MTTSFDADKIESILGVGFRNRDLLLQAFTSQSYGIPHNAPLGMLGDKLWAVVIGRLTFLEVQESKDFQRVFSKTFGQTNPIIVAGIIGELGLLPYLRRGEETLPDVKEATRLGRAIVGAVAVDQSVTQAMLLVQNRYMPIGTKIYNQLIENNVDLLAPTAPGKAHAELIRKANEKKEELELVAKRAGLPNVLFQLIFYSESRGYQIACFIAGHCVGIGAGLFAEEALLQASIKALEYCSPRGIERLKTRLNALERADEADGPYELLLCQSESFMSLDPSRKRRILRELREKSLGIDLGRAP